MSLLLLLLATVTPPDKDVIDQHVRDELGKEQYYFCHDEQYPLATDEHDWCPIVGGVSSRCPKLPDACKQPATTSLFSGRRSFGGWGKGSKHGQGAGKPVEEVEEPRVVRLPALGGLGQVLMWLILGGALFGLAYAIVSNVRKGPQSEGGEEEAQAPEAATIAEQQRGPIETDVERLLARAKAAAGKGNYKQAIDYAYAALLRRLDGDGLIRIHSSRTNGDYVRDLRERPELRTDVRAVVREVERVQFGSTEADAQTFQSVLGRVVPLVARQLAIVFLAIGLFSCGGDTGGTRGRYDDSPSGLHAVNEVLKASGFEPTHRLTPLDKLGDDDELIVLLPGSPVDKENWPKLLDWVRKGGSIVVATGDKYIPPWLGVAMSNMKATVQEAEVGKGFQMPPLRVSIPEQHRLELEGDNIATLLDRKGAPYAAWVGHGKGTIVVLADSYLMTNASLVVGDNATFLVHLLAMLSAKPQFCDELTGASSPSPMASVARGKLAPFLGQVAFLLILFFIYKGSAFGTLRDPPALSRRSFVEHARALGLQYAKARAKRHAFSMYAGYALDRLRERVALGGRRGLSGLAEAVAKKTGRKESDVMRLLVEAQSARDVMASSGVVSHEDLSLLRELSQLLAKTGGAR